jgi:hypothetical protein
MNRKRTQRTDSDGTVILEEEEGNQEDVENHQNEGSAIDQNVDSGLSSDEDEDTDDYDDDYDSDSDYTTESEMATADLVDLEREAVGGRTKEEIELAIAYGELVVAEHEQTYFRNLDRRVRESITGYDSLEDGMKISLFLFFVVMMGVIIWLIVDSSGGGGGRPPHHSSS